MQNARIPRRLPALILVPTLALLLASSALAAGTVTGAVYVEGASAQLAGVAISDGRQVVLTDENGRYHLDVADSFALIRITVPSGYRPLDDRWFDRVHVDGDVRLDFVLVPDDQPDTWTFAHVTDVHITPERVEHVRRFTEDVNTLADPPVALVISTGDLVHNLRAIPDYDGLREAFGMYADAMSGLNAPRLDVIGNHDLAGYQTTEITPEHELFGLGAYRRLMGPEWFSYCYGGVRFVALNNTRVNIPVDRRYHSAWDEEGLRWLEADLAVADEDTPIILLMHQPPEAATNRAEFDTILAGRTVLAIFYGHRHALVQGEYNDIPAYQGGALDRCQNAPTGYQLVTIGIDREIETQYRPVE